MKNYFFVPFILLFCSAGLAQNSVVSGLQFRDVKEDYFGQKDVYEAITKLDLPADGISKFVSQLGAGDVEIKPAQQDAIEVYARVYITESSAEKAYATAVRHLDLSLEKRGNTAELYAQFSDLKRFRPNGKYSVELLVSIPSSIKLINVEDASGEISIKDISAEVNIDDASGDITMDHCSGTFEIIDQSGSISLFAHQSADATCEIEDESGDIYISDARADITIKDASGDITVKSLKGNVIVSDKSGAIDLSDIQQSVLITDDSGDISLHKIGGSIVIDDQSGDIEAKDILGDFEVRSKSSGEIRTSELKGNKKVPKKFEEEN